MGLLRFIVRTLLLVIVAFDLTLLLSLRYEPPFNESRETVATSWTWEDTEFAVVLVVAHAALIWAELYLRRRKRPKGIDT
jgi:hypothetical protein